MPSSACVWVKKPYGDGGWLVDFYAGVDTTVGLDNTPPTIDSAELIARLKINGRMLEALPTAYSDAFNTVTVSSVLNAIAVSPIQADQGAGPEGIMAFASGTGDKDKFIIHIYTTSDISTLPVKFNTQLGSMVFYKEYYDTLSLFGAAFGFVSVQFSDLRSAAIGTHFTDGLF